MQQGQFNDAILKAISMFVGSIGENVKVVNTVLQKPPSSVMFSTAMLWALANALEKNGLSSLTTEEMRLWAGALANVAKQHPAPSSELAKDNNE